MDNTEKKRGCVCVCVSAAWSVVRLTRICARRSAASNGCFANAAQTLRKRFAGARQQYRKQPIQNRSTGLAEPNRHRLWQHRHRRHQRIYITVNYVFQSVEQIHKCSSPSCPGPFCPGHEKLRKRIGITSLTLTKGQPKMTMTATTDYNNTNEL